MSGGPLSGGWLKPRGFTLDYHGLEADSRVLASEICVETQGN